MTELSKEKSYFPRKKSSLKDEIQNFRKNFVENKKVFSHSIETMKLHYSKLEPCIEENSIGCFPLRKAIKVNKLEEFVKAIKKSLGDL